MKINRTKNATRNMTIGAISKVFNIIVQFLIRTAMIKFMGAEFLGLDSLFSSILQVLNLAELGVGSAMVFSMYKPIAEDDEETICALMNLYRLYYHVIGAVIAVVGGVLTPFIPYLIDGELPHGLNIYVLYLLNLAATVLSYWLFAYKNAIFNAHQRVDVPSKVTLFMNVIRYGGQFIIIIFIKNYYMYVIVALLTQALSNIMTAVMADKIYPNYKPYGKLGKDTVKSINHRIRDLFTSKIGAVVVNSADTVVISAFLGLTVLAIYQNYYYILTAVTGIVTIIFSACTAGIGNSIILETKEKNFNDLKTFTFLISWLAGFCTCFFLCLYQPFMEIWVGKDLMLEFAAVICLCVYYFIYEINALLNTYKDAAGIWHEDRFRPLVTAAANLTLNLVTVQFWGIYGVLLSTVISTLFVGMPWLLHNLFTVLFDKSQLRGYLLHLLKYTVIVGISCVTCYFASAYIPIESLWVTLFIRLVVCCIVPNVIYLLVYRRTPEFKRCIALLDRMTRNRLQLERRLTKSS